MSLSLLPAAPPIHSDAIDTLDMALAAYDRSYFAVAGRHLREAIRQTLLAYCEYHDVTLPRRKVRRSTGALAVLLNRRGVLDDAAADWALELIDVGNRAARCAFVTRQRLSTAINEARWFASEQPFAVEWQR